MGNKSSKQTRPVGNADLLQAECTLTATQKLSISLTNSARQSAANQVQVIKGNQRNSWSASLEDLKTASKNKLKPARKTAKKDSGQSPLKQLMSIDEKKTAASERMKAMMGHKIENERDEFIQNFKLTRMEVDRFDIGGQSGGCVPANASATRKHVTFGGAWETMVKQPDSEDSPHAPAMGAPNTILRKSQLKSQLKTSHTVIQSNTDPVASESLHIHAGGSMRGSIQIKYQDKKLKWTEIK